jgi:hypothetical protein
VCVRYVQRFGSWLYSHLQMTGCYYTDRVFSIFKNSGNGWDKTWDLFNIRLVYDSMTTD